jgi:hypothetical protein
MGQCKGPGPKPSFRENPMTEARSNKASPMRTKPKLMTIRVKVKGG